LWPRGARCVLICERFQCFLVSVVGFSSEDEDTGDYESVRGDVAR
jgi:hypothetical protein